MGMSPDLHGRVLPRIMQDYAFKTSDDGKWLNQGRCPSCGKKALFTSAESPWVLKCGRENKCGHEFSIRDLYPEEFGAFNRRHPPTRENPNATADAYMSEARGLNTMKMRHYYTQEKWWSPAAQAGTATVRFMIPGTTSYMERFVEPVEIKQPDGTVEVRKQNFHGAHRGLWWLPPDMAIVAGDEVWIVEGIIDAISLWQNGIKAVAILSCSNYPDTALKNTAHADTVRWVWALDNDKAGKGAIRKFVARMRKEKFECSAAIAPAKSKCDWNDLHRLHKLTPADLPDYRHAGALLIAESVEEKAALIYVRSRSLGFVVDFDNQLYWWSVSKKDLEAATEQIDVEDSANKEEVYIDAALKAGKITAISNVRPEFLYIQRREAEKETSFFARIHFPDGRPPFNLTFSQGQITAPGEFKKQLVSAGGAWWKGEAKHLDWIGWRWLTKLKTVEVIEHLGYSREHGCYLFPKVAVSGGKVYEVSEDDYFQLPKQAIKSRFEGGNMRLETTNRKYRADWAQLVWRAFGTNGMIACVFWFGSMFAEQIRHAQSSFPFLEIVGEPGSGKTSLIEFIWKLFGREDHEGIDPNKNSLVGNQRSMIQYANMPVVFIEADRAENSHAKRFDWDETKGYYNGRGIRVKGKKNDGVETDAPPFRSTLVIAQNSPVNASDAVLERIVQLNFTKAGHNSDSRAATDEMHRLSVEELSYFTLMAAVREQEVLAHITAKTGHYQDYLLKQEGISHARLAKNHAQLIALAEKFAEVAGLADEQRKATCTALVDACRERQVAIAADHPMIAEFWDVFDYLDAQGKDESGNPRPFLNHSHDPKLIAVNLNEFVEAASHARQQIPPLIELKRHLQTSKRRKFVESNRSTKSVLTKRTHRCWIFERGRGELT